MKKVFAILIGLITVSNALSLGIHNDDLKPSADRATMQVRITDSEACSFGLIIEIVNVEVYSDKTGWIVLNDYQQTIASEGFIHGDESLLANNKVPVGTYTKLRLTFGSTNTIYNISYENRKTNELWFMNSDDRQVEIPIHEEIEANELSEILLDFDISTSISVLDNEYILQPVVAEFKDPATKAIETVVDLNTLSAK